MILQLSKVARKQFWYAYRGMIVKYLFVMAACLQIVPPLAVAAEKDASTHETIDATNSWLAGRKLTEAQAKELEVEQ